MSSEAVVGAQSGEKRRAVHYMVDVSNMRCEQPLSPFLTDN